MFAGSISYKNIPKFYADGDLFVNFSDMGSVDKVILEAVATGLLVLTSNEAFRDILPEKYLTEKALEKIITLSKAKKDESLRECIIKDYSLKNLIEKIKQNTG